MSFWKGKRVLVTGGEGFIGSHLVELLLAAGAKVRVADRSPKRWLEGAPVERHKTSLASVADCRQAAEGQEAVFHLAGRVAGVSYNQAHPGTMLRENVLLNTNMLEGARLAGVERFLVVSSACVYRRDAPVPTPETEGFVDDPEPTNFGYGWAKRVAEVQARAYALEFGMKIGVARPYNAYGPRDHFDSESSHVIASLVRRVNAGEDPLVVWGGGEQSRSFLYVRDFADGLMRVLESHPTPDPINLGADEEVKIKELVSLICELSGRSPKLVYDASKPTGQPRRSCDGTKALKVLGWRPRTTLREGLRETIEWYLAAKAASR